MMSTRAQALRSVVKGTFRAFCSELNEASLGVLVDTLQQTSSELFDDDGPDDEEEEEEEEEGRKGGKGGGKTGLMAGGKRARDEAGGKSRAGVDDDEEEEGRGEEEWDDERMFKMDSLIGAAFKSRRAELAAGRQAAAMSVSPASPLSPHPAAPRFASVCGLSDPPCTPRHAHPHPHAPRARSWCSSCGCWS